MTPLVIGLIGEGKHDLMALERVIRHLATTVGRTVTTRRIQPAYIDQSRMATGGDDAVRKWCQIPPERRREVLFPLFPDPDNPACDFVIILHDADQLERMAAKSPAVIPPTPPWTPTDRADFVRAVLDAWLWPDPTSRTAANRQSDYLLAVAVRALETWYVAALNLVTAPEDVDPCEPLTKSWPSLADEQFPCKIRKRRVEKEYKMLNDVLIESIDHVARACPQFGRLIDEMTCRLTKTVVRTPETVGA